MGRKSTTQPDRRHFCGGLAYLFPAAAVVLEAVVPPAAVVAAAFAAAVVAEAAVGEAAEGGVAVLSPHAASNNKPTNRAAITLPAARYFKIDKILNSF